MSWVAVNVLMNSLILLIRDLMSICVFASNLHNTHPFTDVCRLLYRVCDENILTAASITPYQFDINVKLSAIKLQTFFVQYMAAPKFTLLF